MSARLVDQPITERPKVMRHDGPVPYDSSQGRKPWVVAWRTARGNVCALRCRTHAHALERANRAAARIRRIRRTRANGGGIGQIDYALAGPRGAQP